MPRKAQLSNEDIYYPARETDPLKAFRPGQLVDYVLHEHFARRAGHHYDFRFGTPSKGLFSWATRKEIPTDTKTIRSLFPTPVHRYEYGSFEGVIPEGYGAGLVKIADKGKFLISRITDKSIYLTRADTPRPERYVLIRPSKPGKPWILRNLTPSIDYEKEHFIQIPTEEVDKAIKKIREGGSVQEKVDGAHVLVRLLNHSIEVVSPRRSTVTGKNIIHTEKIFGKVPEVDIPKEFRDSILLAELYGEKDGKPIPLQKLNAILGSSLVEALRKRRQNKVKLKLMLFDIFSKGGKKLKNMPYEKRFALLKEIVQYLPKGYFSLPETATDEEAALALWQRITSGKHPRTKEGIIIRTNKKTFKVKQTNEADVYIRGFIPGRGKHRGKVGAILYSLTPDGPIVGKVGTGLSDELRGLMARDPDEWIGRRIRIKYRGKSQDGIFLMPSVIAVHEDYPQRKEAAFRGCLLWARSGHDPSNHSVKS